jgi:hypothetical protein
MDRDCCSCCCCCSFSALLTAGAFLAALLAGVLIRRNGFRTHTELMAGVQALMGEATATLPLH